MVTPTREEIIEYALEAWHNDQIKNGNPAYDIKPELDELKEGGYISLAQSQLMRNQDFEEWSGYNQKIEKFEKNLEKEQQNDVKLKTVIDDILDCGDLLLIANKSHGKTNALKVLSSELRRYPDTRVLIFETFPKFCLEFEAIPFIKIHDSDVSETTHTVDIESYFLRHERDYSVLRGQEIKEALAKNRDLIFTLEISDIERIAFFVYSVVNYFYRRAYLRLYKNYKKRERVVFIIEESQNCFDSSTISKKLFNRLRKIFSEARNLDLHFIMCSQRLQDLNTKIRGRTRLMLGNVSIDDYELKINRLLRHSKYRKSILDFERGKFVYVAKDKIIEFPKFSTNDKPCEFKPTPKPEAKKEKVKLKAKTKKPSLWTRLKYHWHKWLYYPLEVKKPRNQIVYETDGEPEDKEESDSVLLASNDEELDEALFWDEDY